MGLFSRKPSMAELIAGAYSTGIRAMLTGVEEEMMDASIKWGPYKHGRRPSRCVCPDCNRDYALHNRDAHCDCQQCVEFREASMPAPATTSWQAQQDAYQAARQQQYNPYPKAEYAQERIWQNSQYGKPKESKSMGNLNICERPKCNAIIKGNAAGVIDYMTDLDQERQHMVLCPACVGDLMLILTTEPLTDRERAYDKPYTPPSDEDSVAGATAEQLAAALLQKLMNQQAIGAPDASTD